MVPNETGEARREEARSCYFCSPGEIFEFYPECFRKPWNSLRQESNRILSSLFKIPLAILWGIGGRGRSGRRPTDEDAAGVRCEKSDTDANAARQRVLSFTAL